MLASLLFLGHSKYGPESSPLYWLFPLARTLFPLISMWLALLRCHLISEAFPINGYPTALPHTVRSICFIASTVLSTIWQDRCSLVYVWCVLPLSMAGGSMRIRTWSGPLLYLQLLECAQHGAYILSDYLLSEWVRVKGTERRKTAQSMQSDCVGLSVPASHL